MEVSDLRDIPAIILCGGEGSRLRSVVSDRQKAVASVKGRPFLSYIVERLEKEGVREIVLAAGYFAQSVQCFADKYTGRAALRVVVESNPRGTGGACRDVFLDLDSSYRNAFVLNGDTFADVPLRELVAQLQNPGIEVCMALFESTDSARFGSVELSADGVVRSFSKNNTHSTLINAGTYLISRDFLEQISDRSQGIVSLEKVIELSANLYGNVAGFIYKGVFLDIGVPADFARAQTIDYLEGCNE